MHLLESWAMLVRHRFALALFAIGAGCAPESKLPVEVMVLAFDYQTGRYQPKQVQLTTPTDLVALRGPVATLLGDAHFDESPDNLKDVPATAPAAEVRAAITKSAGSAVHVSYIESGGVLVPADFHSLNLVTSYYNFERAFGFFESIGSLTVADFGTPDLYYFASFIEKTDPENDNAAFDPLLGGFVILPFEELQQVPLALNTGVIGHEYSHRVFNYRLFDKAPLPDPYYQWTEGDAATPGYNLLRSLDEGIADVFGTGITCSKDFETCDPTFFGESLPLRYLEARRLDADPPHCLDEDLRLSMLNSGQTFLNEGQIYRVGSVLSGALWRAASDPKVIASLGSKGAARRAMFETLYRAEAGGSDGQSGLRELVRRALSNQRLFRLDTDASAEGVLDAIVLSATDSSLKAALCSAFLDRFKYTVASIPACAGALSYGECP